MPSWRFSRPSSSAPSAPSPSRSRLRSFSFRRHCQIFTSDRSTDDDMAPSVAPMYGASGLAFELPETSADEDAAPAAPPSTARLSSATGSLRRLSSNSFDFANAPKRGDPKRAYAASLMRRCIKKTVVDQTRSPSIAPLFLDPTGLRVRVERFSSVGVPLKRLHEFGCPIAVTLYLDFLLEGFCMFMLLGMLSLPLMFDSTMRNHRRQECRVLHTAEIAAAAAPAVLAVNSTPATPPRAALDPGCGYNTIGVRASLPSSSNSPWRTLLLPAIGTCMDYADTTIRETANVSASERDAIISAAANLTTTKSYRHAATIHLSFPTRALIIVLTVRVAYLAAAWYFSCGRSQSVRSCLVYTS